MIQGLIFELFISCINSSKAYAEKLEWGGDCWL